ncbi:MAG: 2-C-methyl-D-erythritol 2,4-cyclodiphosphate synthase [Lentisphaeria bacterium]|jgi:2-C-methyl-D-erythritol 2,4-cyclodiphosphate synthase|nr:2-C-methyl-D-erythritol 2,4-cyclodiphosphate synthase [Lentisphaeria bacterium]MDY0177012.1 2-C-methyl-D-erythritol 2,4-cyclodiphosphate synthase [Lentisphaeria bacterium]NLZ60399.1 2-C-methyl-D-erythritol 2,4-cyclodiphosphate synthase [Lentisphaerota bacterium]
MRIRIGQGYDIHRLVEGRKLRLGGYTLPEQTRGLLGHSDADVLLHALIDALLGALALGDIGQWFSDRDPQWKDADSALLLKTVLEAPQLQAWKLLNLDATIIAQEPRLQAHIPAIRQSLADLLRCDCTQVSVKAKTNEGLDAVGTGQAIAVQVVLLVGH